MDKNQKNSRKATLPLKNTGEAQKALRGGKPLSLSSKDPEILRGRSNLMKAICQRENLNKAYKNVLKNRGAPGIDGMTTDDLLPYLKEHGQRIIASLKDRTFKLQPVKEVEIPKTGGKGTRKLGIPTVIDRFVCQAILQILQRIFDPKFSDHSYGFRPGKSAHQAINQAKHYVTQGYSVVVDIDLENFFGQVNHDKLMSEIAKAIKDMSVIKLLRRLLNAGILTNGLVTMSSKGTPQGNPLSPLLSNIMLDLLDKELERRDHRFCRYADDCNVYVRSRRAGKRVMQSLTNFIEKRLKLKVNHSKSSVGSVTRRTFLGFAFCSLKTNPKIKIPPEVVRRFKGKVRQLTRAGKWMRMKAIIANITKYCRGWLAYFRVIQARSVLGRLERWVRRRLRCAYWRQWKTGANRLKQLLKLGVEEELARKTAWSSKGPWRISLSPALNLGLSNRYFFKQGIPLFICKTR